MSCSQTPEDRDAAGWSACHCAIDASSYSWRAHRAAMALIPITPLAVLNSPITGQHALGSTCLHLACDGSDVSLRRNGLARQLLDRGVNLEAKQGVGSTPLLLACGAGVADVVRTLVHAGADVHTTNNRGLTTLQAATCCSRTSRAEVVEFVQSWVTWVPSCRQRSSAHSSESLITRRLLSKWRV